MKDSLSPEQLAIIDEESAFLGRIQNELTRQTLPEDARSDFDRELIDLRDQLSETRAEDHAMLVEHMTRVAALRLAQDRRTELPTDPANPYFAHLRLKDRHQGEIRVRDVAIGRRAFIDSRRGVNIVDWRNSPISRIYYCYEEGDEYEERFGGQVSTGSVEARRTITIARGRLKRIRNSEWVLARDEEGWEEESLERSRLSGGVGQAIRAPGLGGGRESRHLPEITALIDPEQFRAISDARTGVVIINGGAGTGKTTIALHRIAYLHFQDPRRFCAKNMLVVTPGDGLRRYVSQVLPALDVRGVPIKTFGDWAFEVAKRLIPELKQRTLLDDVPSGARRLKRHPALVAMLEQAVRDEARAFDDEMAEVGGPPLLDAWVRRRTLPPMQRLAGVQRWLETGGANEIGSARMMSVRRLLEQAELELKDPVFTWAELLTDRGRLVKGFAAAGERPYEWELDQLVDTVSKQLEDPMDVRSFDEEFRTGVDGLAVDEGTLAGALDFDDLAAILRICQLKYGRLGGPSGRYIAYEHIVVDEAQDLSPLIIKVLSESVRQGSPVTLAGDTAQRVVMDSGFSDWAELNTLLKLRATILPPLSVTYRSTRQVMALARHVLGDLAPAVATRDVRDGAPVQRLHFDEMGEAVAFLADALKSLKDRERLCSAVVLTRTPALADLYFEGLRRADVPALRRVCNQEFDFTPGIDVTDVYQVKGLEYDYVILVEGTREHFPDAVDARHLLHVAATRAAYQLWLIDSGPVSPLLPNALKEGRPFPE